MSVTTDPSTIIEDNKLLDAMDYMADLGRPLRDEEVDADLARGAARFVKTFTDRNSFMESLRRQLDGKGSLTNRQLRAALNVMRDRMANVKIDPDWMPEDTDLVGGRYICKDCGFGCSTWPQLRRHKQVIHGVAKPWAPETEEVTPGTVIEDLTDTGLDLSAVPDGTYAAPDSSGKGDFVFLRVRRVRTSKRRDRRYTFGKIRHGKEFVSAGTIEVRQWGGDTKRLCGEQKVGGTYRGEFAQEWRTILTNPAVWAKIAGVKIEECCICSRTLTSEWKDYGIGPECFSKNTYWTDKPKDWLAVEQAKKQNDPERPVASGLRRDAMVTWR